MKVKLLTLTSVVLALGTSAWAQTVTTFDDSVNHAANSDGTIANGNGNLNGGFKVVTDNDTGLQLGLRGKLDHSNTWPDNGNGIYTVPTGPGNNFAGGPPNTSRASWNYEFSIDTSALGTSSGKTLGNYTFTLLIDQDPGTSDNFYSFNPLLIGDNRPASSATLAQNSENALFPLVGVPGLDVNANGIYDIILEATDNTTGATVSDEITIDVGDVSHVPDATSTMPLLGAALAGMALIRRKFKA